MANTIYANTDTGHVSSNGGHVQLAVAAGSTAQVNSGTAVPCRVAYISGLSTGRVNWSINTSTNVSEAGFLPTASDGAVVLSPIEVPIDDVSKIWVFASLAASVNITYRT